MVQSEPNRETVKPYKESDRKNEYDDAYGNLHRIEPELLPGSFTYILYFSECLLLKMVKKRMLLVKSPEKAVIIRAVASDLNAILSLSHETIKVSYRPYYPEEAVKYFIAYHSIDSIREDTKNGYSIVCLVDGKIVGTGSLAGRTVKRVFIHPSEQGKGFGSLIMSEIERKAKMLHLEFLELHASLPSKQFYERHGYKSLKYCRLPVTEQITLDYHQMGKMLRKVKHPPTVNLHGKIMAVVRNDGPDSEVSKETRFSFSQVDELIAAEYHGGKVEDGILTGYIDGDAIVFHYVQINTDGERNSGNSIDAVEIMKNGNVRLIDRWKWETKTGEGFCILEEI
jgi:GNAT superfamily N-acetyltransferase